MLHWGYASPQDEQGGIPFCNVWSPHCSLFTRKEAHWPMASISWRLIGLIYKHSAESWNSFSLPKPCTRNEFVIPRNIFHYWSALCLICFQANLFQNILTILFLVRRNFSSALDHRVTLDGSYPSNKEDAGERVVMRIATGGAQRPVGFPVVLWGLCNAKDKSWALTHVKHGLQCLELALKFWFFTTLTLIIFSFSSTMFFILHHFLRSHFTILENF